MLFISLVIWNVLMSFYGRSETYVSHAIHQNPGRSADERAAGKALGLPDSMINSTQKETKKTAKEHGHSLCSYCEKYDFQLPEGVKFKSCARCNAIGRTTLYCSK